MFEQSKGRIDFKETLLTNQDGTRTKFSVRKFMVKYHLKQPIAINFFQAQYDASVPDSIKHVKNFSHNG